jgi:hypothetical protein
MNLKQQLLETLQDPNFPDLKLLYSEDSLTLASEILDELLEDEKQDFYKKLETPDSEITFDTFEDTSLLDYYFGILEHYQ